MGWLCFPRGDALTVSVPELDGDRQPPSSLAVFMKPLTRRAPGVGLGGVFSLLRKGHSPSPGGFLIEKQHRKF